MTWLQTVILGIVEGITEFLPISSTGHMIIASSIMGINEDAFTKLFEVCIQFGAILSVVVLYWRKFFDFSRLNFYLKLIAAFIPAAIFGLLFSKKIDALLESAMTVGITMLLGGIVLMFIDKMFKTATVNEDKQISYPKAFIIGCFQVLAMIPGVSRSAATIVGGLQQRLTRRLAAEFSFFLAVPTMFAATVKKLWDYHKEGLSLQGNDMQMLIVGNIIAFIVAMIAIKSFIQYVQKHSFRAFGVYRIIAGIAILGLIFAGVIKNEKAPDAAKPAVAKVAYNATR
ncbi:MAG: undecaprenyl-diphosphate phosphatase [Bacteroidetes bacterium]|nr:undecaprenyl-diphosphate phosphatase [Bacteroidota bacterium]